MKPKIKITLVDKKGSCPCHRGHKIGDSFDYDTQRGELCPMAMHVAFPYIDILRYGGTVPPSQCGEVRFCCPDSDVINVFRLDIIEPETAQCVGLGGTARAKTGSPRRDRLFPQSINKIFFRIIPAAPSRTKL